MADPYAGWTMRQGTDGTWYEVPPAPRSAIANSLMAVRDKIPENPNTGWSATNMLRGGLERSANLHDTVAGYRDPKTADPLDLVPMLAPGAVAASMRPGNALGAFGGRMAAGAPPPRMWDRAAEMRGNGQPEQRILSETGLQHSPLHGDFGFYIPTTDMQWKGPPFGGALPQVHQGQARDFISAPTLFSHYPQMETLPTFVAQLMAGDGKGALGTVTRPERTNPLRRDDLFDLKLLAADPNNAARVARHELGGHGVDFIENRGYSLDKGAMPIDPNVDAVGYLRSRPELSARMAETSPYYHPALTSGGMLYREVSPWRHPGNAAYDELLREVERVTGRPSR